MSRPDEILDDLLTFLKNEREMYGDWTLNPPPETGGRPDQLSRESNSAGEQPERKTASSAVQENSGEPENPVKRGAAAGTEAPHRKGTPSGGEGSPGEDARDGTPRHVDSTGRAVRGEQSRDVASQDNGSREEAARGEGSRDEASLDELLLACSTLEELKTLCSSAEALKTDLEETNLVFGVGNPDADLMLIGEAPGYYEDRQGEPFVGKAGQLLNKILNAINLAREEVYIANILKHRPPNNRDPKPEERERSLPYLMRQIDLVEPKLILCLGRVSATTLLDRDDSLRNLRGKFHPFRTSELMVTYHPAALLRNEQWKRPTWEDVQKLRERYDKLGCRP